MSSSPVTQTPEKKVHVETWGCQMNVADSEKMVALLKSSDYRMVDQADDADLIILNTCHIREKARHKVVSRLGKLKDLKHSKPNLKIAVAGCVAQAEGKRLLSQVPTIDVLLGPGRIHELPRLLSEHEADGSQKIAVGFPKTQERGSICPQDHVTEVVDGKNPVSRYVTIQQGCNNFCTFCVVPFTRGREVSERPDVVRAKVKAMLKLGAKEVTLLGQNVNSYGLDLVESGDLPASSSGPFVDLLTDVAQLEGLERLRITTSNPHDLSYPLATLYGQEPKLGRYFHLPVQSGSDAILKAMKRKITSQEYFERVAWLREGAEDMALSTDLIVGFPGETDDDFLQTLELVEKVRFNFAFAFKYSPRKNTAAIRFRTQVDEATKSSRLQKLNQVLDRITDDIHASYVGSEAQVLFLYRSRKEPDVFYGRDEHFSLVRAKSSRDIVGRLLSVRIEAANRTALAGTLL